MPRGYTRGRTGGSEHSLQQHYSSGGGRSCERDRRRPLTHIITQIDKPDGHPTLITQCEEPYFSILPPFRVLTVARVRAGPPPGKSNPTGIRYGCATRRECWRAARCWTLHP